MKESGRDYNQNFLLVLLVCLALSFLAHESSARKRGAAKLDGDSKPDSQRVVDRPQKACGCALNDISSVMVSLSHLVVSDGENKQWIVPEDSELDLINHLLVFEVEQAIEAKKVRLILMGEDNHILDEDGNDWPLRRPGKHRNGFKLELGEAQRLEAGETYVALISIDDSSHFANNKKGCFIKPSFKLDQIKKATEVF